jgi:hypothetical protein
MPASGFDAESEARKLLELMGIAGVLPAETVSSILAKNQKPDDGIIDAEVVSDLEDRPIYRDFDNNDPGQ